MKTPTNGQEQHPAPPELAPRLDRVKSRALTAVAVRHSFLAFLILLGVHPAGHAAPIQILYDTYGAGQPYVTVTSSVSWANPWDITVTMTVPSNSLYCVRAGRAYGMMVTVNGVGTYQGNGVWVCGTRTATFLGAEGYELMQPSWFTFYPPPSFLNWSLVYPYVTTAPMSPGGSASYGCRWQWSSLPSGNRYLATDCFAEVVRVPSIRQMTDRTGGGGPCGGCCQIKHRQPVLNPEGTAFMFASTWNKDAAAGSPNTNRNLEVFRCDIGTGGFSEQTFTMNALSVPCGYAGAKVLLLSSCPEWAGNTDTNLEVCLFSTASPTNVQAITSTQGPLPIDLGTNTCPAPWFSTNQWPTLGNLCPDIADQGNYAVWAANRNIPTADAPSGSNADQNYEVFWMDLASGRVCQLTTTIGGDDVTPANAANLWPRVSREGSRVVFVSDRPLTGTAITTNRYGIFLWEVSRGLSRCTTASVPAEREFPAFGMDAGGTRIVFASDADLVSSNADGNSEIYTMDLGTGSIRQITSTTGAVANSRPILSGDGKKIAFLSNGDFTGLNSDGSQELWIHHSEADRAYPEPFVQVTRLAATPSAREGRAHWMDWYSLDKQASAIVICSCGDLVGQNAANEYEIFLATFDWDPEPEVSITNLEFQPPASLRLYWNGNRTNLAYTVESTTDLDSAAWSAFPPTNQWPVTNTSWTNLSVPDSRQFFRIRAAER